MTFLTTGDKSRVETAERDLTAALSLLLSFSLPGFCKQKTTLVTDLHHNYDRLFPVADPWVLRY